MSIRIEGDADLQRVADALQAADPLKEVGSALRVEAKPLGLRVLRRGAEPMPHRGGFSGLLRGKGAVEVSTAAKGSSVSVTLTLRNQGANLKSLDEGTLHHPVFARAGMPRVWVRQSVPAGAYTKALDAEAREVETKADKAAQGVLDDVARKA